MNFSLSALYSSCGVHATGEQGGDAGVRCSARRGIAVEARNTTPPIASAHIGAARTTRGAGKAAWGARRAHLAGRVQDLQLNRLSVDGEGLRVGVLDRWVVLRSTARRGSGGRRSAVGGRQRGAREGPQPCSAAPPSWQATHKSGSGGGRAAERIAHLLGEIAAHKAMRDGALPNATGPHDDQLQRHLGPRPSLCSVSREIGARRWLRLFRNLASSSFFFL